MKFFDRWEKRNRIKNLVWTTSEKKVNVRVTDGLSLTDTKDVQVSSPEVLMKVGLKEDQADNVSLFAAAHEGAHVKYSDHKALVDYLRMVKEGNWDKEIANGLVQIIEDYRVDMLTAKERPGYLDLREKSADAIIKTIGRDPVGNETTDLLKAISSLTHGIDMRDCKDSWKDMVDWDKAVSIADDIMSKVEDLIRRGGGTSYDSTALAEELYKSHFMKEDENEGKGGSDGNGGEGEEKKNKSTRKSRGGRGDSGLKGLSENGDTEEEEEGEDENGDDSYDDADDDSDDADGDDSVDDDELDDDDLEEEAKDLLSEDLIEKMADDLGKLRLSRAKREVGVEHDKEKDLEARKKANYEDVRDRYGNCLWTPEDHALVQRMLCKGVHAGTGLHYYDATKYGKAKTKIEEAIRRRLSDRYSRQAKKLAAKLREILRAAKQEQAYISDSGRVVANRAWRFNTLHDGRNFMKHDYNEEGGYVVDLLLDASGSNRGREGSIRPQAYVIAEALTEVGIPCRVTMFTNPNSVTVIGRLRDYDDPKECNINCFGFVAEADNRDGLAIEAVTFDLMKRKESKKILIVLSDGSPGDICGRRLIEDAGGLSEYYDGREYCKAIGAEISGVEDTAQVIRRIRSKGIALMGIYVGNRGDTLEAEKLMYGNDFAYIKSMDNFADLVVRYLQKQIMNLG